MPRVFEGRTFYLARSLHTDDRKKANNLILTHGGKVTKDTQAKSVTTVVDKRALVSKSNPGTWVPAELIYDSVDLGEMQPLEKYHSTLAQKGKAIRRRVKYTVEDDVRMLDFLEKHENGRLPGVGVSVSLKAWELAEKMQVTTHSAASMNEHYRKILNKWTPNERRNAIENAKKLKVSSREEAVEPAEAPVSNLSSSPKPVSQATHHDNERDEPSHMTSEPTDAVETIDEAQEEQVGLQQHATPKRTDTRIRSKIKFTEEDDALILDSIQRQSSGNLLPPNKIQQKVWIAAASQQNNKYSAASIKQHYRAIWNKFTPTELRNAAAKAKLSRQQEETEESSSTDEETISVSATKATESAAISSQKRKATVQAHPASDHNYSEASVATEDLSEPVRKRNKKTRAISSTSEQSATEEDTQLPVDGAGVKEPTESAKTAEPSDTVSRDAAHVDEEASEQEDSENRLEETPGGMVIHSYWENRLAEATREEISQYLQPRKPAMPLVANEQSPNCDHQTPEESAMSTLAKRRQRSDGSNPSSRATSVVEGAGATTESIVTSKDEAEKLISRIQLETGQHNDAVVHALFFTSGSVDAAISFLRGSSSPAFWNADDDLVLQSWARVHETLPSTVLISAAMEKEAFAALSAPRSVDAISKRLKFLS